MTTTTPPAGPCAAGPRRLLPGAAGALPALARRSLSSQAAGRQDSRIRARGTVPASPDPAVAARLRDLADHPTSVPADHHSGPYTYTHSQGWNGLDLLGGRRAPFVAAAIAATVYAASGVAVTTAASVALVAVMNRGGRTQLWRERFAGPATVPVAPRRRNATSMRAGGAEVRAERNPGKCG
jgi:hypothetical protein